MRRIVSCLVALGALIAFSSTVQAGHSPVELNYFFGAGAVNPGSPPNQGSYVPNNADALVNQQIMAMPGDIVCLPILVRMLAGNNASGFMNTVAVEIFAAGDSSSVAYDSGGVFNPFPAGAPNLLVGPTAGSGAAHPSGGPGVQLMDTIVVTRNTAVGGSALNVAAGTRLLGYVYVKVLNSAANGDMIDLYFSNSTDVTYNNAFGSALTADRTTAFGAAGQPDESDADGLNSYRYQDANLDVIGVTLGLVSTLADASIKVIPEPATMGLLGLGLLAIRRRRA